MPARWPAYHAEIMDILDALSYTIPSSSGQVPSDRGQPGAVLPRAIVRGMPRTADVTIIGAGIVGLATAVNLTERHPRARVVVLDKEPKIAAHQTGHNSGVIHSGIYYKPGSFKARLCVEGARLMTQFCDAHGIGYERCGKVIVATSEEEVPRLNALHERGTANGVPGLKLVSGDEIREWEPHVRAVRGMLYPATGIVDYTEVANRMAALIGQRGAEVITGAVVRAIRRDGVTLTVETEAGPVATRYLINCAGLHSDRVAALMGIHPDVQIIPFRGEYYMLRPERRSLVRGLIYPVPDPRFPFLGVHFTRTVHGDVEAGPNAGLAFRREGYSRWNFSPRDIWEWLRFPGFWRMAGKYWRTGMSEMFRSLSKRSFCR